VEGIKMSLAPRNIVADSPESLRAITFITFGDPTGIEASPIYTEISGTCTINGTYNNTFGGTEDVDYIYDNAEVTPDSLDTRVALRDLSPFPALINYRISELYAGYSPFYVDVGATSDIVGSGEFVAVHGHLVSRKSTPLDIPIFSTDLVKTNTTAGIRRDNTTDPPTEIDIGATITLKMPFTRGTIEDGDLVIVFQIFAEMESRGNYTMELEVATTGWDSTDFRDIRGTYSATTTDPDGIEYDWSITIG
jgi:hypothetical protein